MGTINYTEQGMQLLAKMRETENVNQADFFDLNVLTYTEEVRDMCKQNSCGRYDRAWNCPPACGSIEELEAACKHYSNGILVNCVSHIKDSFDWEGMIGGGKVLCDLLVIFDDYARELKMEDYRVFGSAGCSTCEECTYPDEPCRNPDRLYTPIEACGINVMLSTKAAGFKYINGQNTVTFFGMILYN